MFETEFQAVDLDEAATPEATSVLFRIPKNLLSLSAVEVPVVVASGVIGSISDYNDDMIFDFADDLTFDSLRYLDDPTLTTFGDGVPTPGAPYAFSISGLQPNDSFNLFLDEELILSDTLDEFGSYNGSFTFPADLSPYEIHFLTAQDSTGEFAYTITCPEPTTSGLVAMGIWSFASLPASEHAGRRISRDLRLTPRKPWTENEGVRQLQRGLVLRVSGLGSGQFISWPPVTLRLMPVM